MPFAQKQQCPHLPQLTRLPDEAGQGVVAKRLEEVASQVVRFYERQVPILASLFAEPALLARYRQALATIGAGPHRANQALAAHLRAERELGRIDASVDPDAGAAMLLGACFQRAFFSAFSGEPIPAAGAHAWRPAWSPASCPTRPSLVGHEHW
jgi:hypothetical protein